MIFLLLMFMVTKMETNNKLMLSYSKKNRCLHAKSQFDPYSALEH